MTRHVNVHKFIACVITLIIAKMAIMSFFYVRSIVLIHVS